MVEGISYGPPESLTCFKGIQTMPPNLTALHDGILVVYKDSELGAHTKGA